MKVKKVSAAVFILSAHDSRWMTCSNGCVPSPVADISFPVLTGKSSGIPIGKITFCSCTFDLVMSRSSRPASFLIFV
jgi:hypothetical protein